jgi:hypothetical protein
MKKCNWTACWHGAYVYPGDCGEGGDMGDKDCPKFVSLENKLKDWEDYDNKKGAPGEAP